MTTAIPSSSAVDALTPAMRRIVELVREHGPLSGNEIASRAHVSKSTLSGGGYLRELRRRHLVHVAGWQKNGNGFTTPLFGFGPAADCPRPLFSGADRDSEGMSRIVAALARRGAMTYREIAEVCGLSRNTIKNARYMEILVAQQRVHVCAWRRNRNGPMAAVYAAGAGPNEPKPAPLSGAERLRRYRTRCWLLAGSGSLLKNMVRHLPGY